MNDLARRIALRYLLFGFAWILVTDLAMFFFIPAEPAALFVSILKGLLFVLFSALVIWLIAAHEQSGNRLAEEKYKILIDNILDIHYTADNQGRLTYLSPQAESYGLGKADLGRQVFDLIIPEDRERLAKDFEKTMTTGREFPSLFRVKTSGGEVRWLEERGKALKDGRGRIIGVTGIIRDVTEVQEAKAQLEERLRELEIINKAAQAREDKIIELKQEVQKLKEELGRENS